MEMDSRATIRLALPKGRMYEGVDRLLTEAGLQPNPTARSYRPVLGHPAFDAKLLKPQNIVGMLDAGSRDVGFTGRDWVDELDGELVELLDTGLDPVRLVVAGPEELVGGGLPDRPVVVASEYERLTRRWIADRGLDASFVRSYGATEVFPPEDADLIVDNAATGATLRANGLTIVDEIGRSSTRLFACPRALEDPQRRAAIDELVLLVRSVLDARRRVMVEVNVVGERLAGVLDVLPCMREPTVSQLAGGSGYAVKAAVPRDELPRVIPRLKAAGGADVVVTRLAQIVP